MNKLSVICAPLANVIFQIGLVSSSRDSASISKLLSCVFAFPLKKEPLKQGENSDFYVEYFRPSVYPILGFSCREDAGHLL